MAAARSLSSSLQSPPGSATAESFRNQAASPEPHYRLSRLNPPQPQSASLRPPSVISRSVSAGFTFKREKDRESPTPEKMDDRAPSRSLFGLRKKGSLASMASTSRVDDTSMSRSTSTGSSLASTPIRETPPTTPLLAPVSPMPIATVDTKTRQTFQQKTHWRVQRRVKTHPYPDVPYMQSFESTVLESERYSHQLLRRLLPDGSPTFHSYKHTPPQSVLELGCGIGAWLQDAARVWRTTQFVGLDLVNVALPAVTDGTLPNVRLQLGDFLNYPLPFGKNTFELVRMANLALCVPFDRWEALLREVNRVLVPGGRLELIDDQTIFSYGDAPAEESPEELALTNNLTTPTTAATGSSTPRPSATPDTSAFFDSDSDDESDEGKPGSSIASGSDSASERSSFTDTASTLIGDPSERGSVEIKKLSSDFGPAPRLDFEPTHRPFSGVEHLIISIPPPSPLATVEIAVDGTTPLTPIPPTRAVVHDTPLLSATSLAASSSVPSSPGTVETTLADAGPAGPWANQAESARDLERVYQRMLSTQFGVHTKPSEVFPAVLSKVFPGVEPHATMHLKLAPLDAPHRDDLIVMGLSERRKKERMVTTPTIQEWTTETAIPQGLSAKAAERLGIAGPGPATSPNPLRRQQTMSSLVGTPEESDEDDFSDDDLFSDSDLDSPSLVVPKAGRPPLERGVSDWVAPNEWDGPPEPPRLQRMGSAPMLQRMDSTPLLASSSSKTITPSLSSKTITASSSSRTIKAPGGLKPMTHTRNGSAASTASALSTASARSNVSMGSYVEARLGPQKYAKERMQHPGLILWPSTFIPISPEELQHHATKHMQTLLGCKPALAQYVSTFKDPKTGEAYVSEEEFEQSIWDYECFLRSRFNWPQLAEARMEADDAGTGADDLIPTPVSATFGRREMRYATRPATDVHGRATLPFDPQELTHVRSFRVFGAVKAGAAALRKNPSSTSMASAYLGAA
ncbi:Methyltransf-25 domain-containing protein [Mycena chlorophos]|uniref:Methyltransf-25 domain-containing protein n=1 Tax=Mycena chlorophos TaxID=658473 RepID=A0A8H6SND2_MYCCL|nr:Methyltransf-25 domain-containing protein [Mycena chlorophos]